MKDLREKEDGTSANNDFRYALGVEIEYRTLIS